MTSKETPKQPPRTPKRNPALPEGPAHHPNLPAIEPAKPVPSLDPETAALLESMRQALVSATTRLSLPVPQGPQEIVLSPALLKAIEQRAVERVVHPLLMTLKEVREASAEARAIREEVQKLGEAATKEITTISTNGQGAVRLVGGETRRQIEDLHTNARKTMRVTTERTLRWHQNLTWHTRTRLREVGNSAADEMRASTRAARKVTEQLGQTVATLEECADAILYVAPALTQHNEVRTRSIVRSTALTATAATFAGLALVVGVLWRAGLLH